MNASPALPFRLRHFALYAASVAMVFVLDRIARSAQGEIAVEFGTTLLVMDIAHAVISGASLGAFLLWMSRSERSRAFPQEPGHWMLVSDGLVFLVGWAASFATLKLQREYALWWSSIAFYMAAAPVYVAILTSAIRTRPLPTWWQMMFVLVVGSELLMGIWSALIFFGLQPMYQGAVLPPDVFPYLSALDGGLILIAVILDRANTVRRDWLHWVGVVTWWLGTAWAWAWRFL